MKELSRRIPLLTVLAAAAAILTIAPPAAADPDEGEVLTAMQNRIERIAEDVGQSVVSIRVQAKVTVGGGGSGRRSPWDMVPPEFRRFFDDELPRRRTPEPEEPREEPREELVPRGLGSGIIISDDGYILTNQHVIDGADEIEVTLADKRSYKAELVGEDTRRDLAVLKIDADELQPARLGSDIRPRRGMFVLAIGNPFGFGAEGQASVSFGIVSGTRRSLAMPTTRQEDRYYGKLIQTDAAVNPGNSGGALCDLDGNVIGVNVAIASRSGGSQGVGFAIPIDKLTVSIIDQLKRGEQVAYGYLGVGIRNPTSAESEVAGTDPGFGAFVETVQADSPAEAAGIMPADLIVAIDSQKIIDADDLVTEVGRKRPGDKIKLTLYRSGDRKTVEATVVRRDLGGIASAGDNGADLQPGESGFQWRGMVLKDLTAALRREAGVGDNVKGVYVDRVASESPAYRAGIRPGSIIDQVGSKRVADLDAFQAAVKTIEGAVFVNVHGRGPEVVPAE